MVHHEYPTFPEQPARLRAAKISTTGVPAAFRLARSSMLAKQPRCDAPGSLSIKLSQQRASFFQFSQVKPLGEPVVDGGEQVTSLRVAPHPFPKTCQANRCPQLPGFGLLLPSNLKTVQITLLRSFLASRCPFNQITPDAT